MKAIPVVANRRKRTWAKTAEEMQNLGRSATQLARSSAGRMREAAVAKRLAKFAQLTEIENACKLMRGDLLVQLIDDDGLRAIDIARVSGLRPSDLSQMYKTAKAFPAELRPEGVPYNLFLLASRMMRKFPVLKMRPQTALDQIRRLGFSQRREVGRHFARVARLAESRRAARGLEWAGDSVTNRTYHKRFQELVDQVADGSAKIIHVDPPYVYRKTVHGHYASKSARSQVCDSQFGRAAAAMVVDLLRDWQSKLAGWGIAAMATIGTAAYPDPGGHRRIRLGTGWAGDLGQGASTARGLRQPL